jgi:ribonuclease HII
MDRPDRIAGVDEAGRGPLAGPVVVAAVILGEGHQLQGLDDSKRLSADTRERLFPEIQEIAVSFAVEIVDVEEIDRLNILRATLTGMRRSVLALEPRPTLAMIDCPAGLKPSLAVTTGYPPFRLLRSWPKSPATA